MHIVKVPCKPYVKKFLISSYGNPVNVKKDKHIYKYLQKVLERKLHRNNGRASFKQYGKMIYHEEVELVINKDTFKHNGFDLHREDVTDLNAIFEGHIKKIICVFIFALMSCGFKKINAITEAQKVFGFSEDDMSTELIIQACKREGQLRKKIISQVTCNISQTSLV